MIASIGYVALAVILASYSAFAFVAGVFFMVAAVIGVQDHRPIVVKRGFLIALAFWVSGGIVAALATYFG